MPLEFFLYTPALLTICQKKINTISRKSYYTEKIGFRFALGE